MSEPDSTTNLFPLQKGNLIQGSKFREVFVVKSCPIGIRQSAISQWLALLFMRMSCTISEHRNNILVFPKTSTTGYSALHDPILFVFLFTENTVFMLIRKEYLHRGQNRSIILKI